MNSKNYMKIKKFTIFANNVLNINIFANNVLNINIFEIKHLANLQIVVIIERNTEVLNIVSVT